MTLSLLKRSSITLLTLFALAACGGDSADTPSEKCEMVASAHCSRLGVCGRQILNSGVREQDFVDECEASFRQDLCDDAVGVSLSFDRCLNDLPSAACVIDVSSSGGFTPDLDVPTSCNDVVTTR